ncbi:MAG: sulfotransferase [Alphaproteobacteria bacterium]|nr:sulfotransferase [Alphaproteobacteria bacterium]
MTEPGKSKKPVKVIYIASFSRSGSTVLDTVLGNQPQVAGHGELMRLATSGWMKNEYCSCSEPVNACPFWREVYAHWHKKTGGKPEDYAVLQDRFERFRRLPILLKEHWKPSRDFKEYAEMTVAMFQAVQKVSGCNIIVDSSKYPFRALALSMIPDIDLRLIHLVRNSHAVAWSMAKPYKKDAKIGIEKNMKGVSVIKTALLWNLVNTQISWLRKQLPKNKSVLLRYEHFTESPKTALKSLSQVLELDMQPLLNKINNEEAFQIKHFIAGNRLRMNKEIYLQKHIEWRREMPISDQRKVNILTGFLLKHYGFRA